MRSFQFDARLTERLTGPLRALIGCAEQLYGEIEDVDQVKIHIQSSKITLLRYEHYADVPLPRLRERIKIDLREQDIRFFHYDGNEIPQFLYMKSRRMSENLAGYERQKTFDDELLSLKMFDFSGSGPPADEFVAHLRAARIRIRGFTLAGAGNSPTERRDAVQGTSKVLPRLGPFGPARPRPLRHEPEPKD